MRSRSQRSRGSDSGGEERPAEVDCVVKRKQQLRWCGALLYSDSSIPLKQGDWQGPDEVEPRLVDRGPHAWDRWGELLGVCGGVLKGLSSFLRARSRRCLQPSLTAIPAAQMSSGRGSEGRFCGMEKMLGVGME